MSGIFVLQALHVLTPVKESRSDLDLKNLPLQTGTGSKRRHSALTLGSLRLKFSASKKEVYNCCTTE